MSDAASQIRVRDQGGVTRVEFTDQRIVDEAVIQQIGKELLKLVDASAKPAIVLDFSGVEHLSSAALGVLISVNTRAKARGGQVRLCCISKSIFEVFRITRLDRVLQNFGTLEQALQGLA